MFSRVVHATVVLFARHDSTVRTNLQVIALFRRAEFWIWEGCGVLPLSALCLALVCWWPRPRLAEVYVPSLPPAPVPVADSSSTMDTVAAVRECELTEIEPGAAPDTVPQQQAHTHSTESSAELVVEAIDLRSAAPAADAVPDPPAPPQELQWVGVCDAIGSALLGSFSMSACAG
jgi:hypothetical protein